jgi:hypothetical protein
MEQMALDAIARRSVRDLFGVHNAIMSDVVSPDDGGKSRLSDDPPMCWSAYTKLAFPVLFYARVIDPTAGAIDPSVRTDVFTEVENAMWGDDAWADYLEDVVRCEEAIGIKNPPKRPERPSEMLRSILPKIPK